MVGGVVVEVVVVGGAVVVVVVVVLVVVDVVVLVVGGGGTNVNMAWAQSAGCTATTTSTPGMVEKVQTLRGGPLWRQARAGALVVMPVTVPTNWAVPSDVGGVTGVSGTVAPFQTAVVANPVPGGSVTVGPVW